MTPPTREPGDDSDSDSEPEAALPPNVTQLEPWKSGLRMYADKQTGEPLLTACFENVALILTHDADFQGCFARNELSGETELVKKLKRVPHMKQARIGTLDEYAVAHVRHALSVFCKLSVSTEVAIQGIEYAARQRCYNPLHDELTPLKWDGVARLDTWLSTYLGVAPSDYANAIGRWWLVSLMARAYRPGCQCDHVLVLEGPQGARKSSALRILAGEKYFSDQLPDLSSKDALQHLLGIWILELGEMDGLSRHDVTRIKAFLTVRSDRYRAAFGRFNERHPRTCVFAGTTNGNEYLRDDTGNRRFWPVRVGTIDLKALERDRDVLLAEARLAYEGGAQWWPDKTASKLIQVEQDARYHRDEWEQKVETHVAILTEVTVGEILGGPLGLEPGKWGMAEQKRVGSCLKRLGWARRQVREGNDRTWHWVRETPETP